MAQGVADNFTSVDKWLSKSIENGSMTGEYNISNIANNYTAYLEENHIFDDVKDVIEAYDLQVEEAANNFSKNIISDFTDLINKARTVLRKMSTAIEDFKYSIVKIKSVMEKNITSTHIKVISTGYNEWETEEIKNYHGSLAEMFPSYIVANINSADKRIIPIIDSIYSDINLIELYNLGIYNMREYFNSIIEKAVYSSMELHSIIEAQNLISIRLTIMIKEIEKVNESIQLQYKGNSLKAFQEQLHDLVKILNYFDLMINDCF